MYVYEGSDRFKENEIDSIYECDDLLFKSISNGDVHESVRLAHLIFDWFWVVINEDSYCILHRLNLFSGNQLKFCRDKLRLDIGAESLPVFEVDDSQFVLKEKLTNFIVLLANTASSMDSSRESQIRKVITDYMQKHYIDDITLRRVAHELKYSESHFGKLFKTCFDITFIDFLTEIRITEAKGLLKNPMYTVKEIGSMVGYRDNNYFTKVFRKLTGKSPTEYRTSKWLQ